jgi:hypothetical protein
VLHAALNLPRPADSGGVHDFNFALMVAYNCPVNISCSAGFTGHKRLLLFSKSIKQAGFANVWPAKQRYLMRLSSSLILAFGKSL